MSLNTDKLNKLQRLAPVRSSELLGDGKPIYNEHGELTCDVCGKHELGLGWPTPHICMECGKERDRNILKACPFCGTNRTRTHERIFGAYVHCECGGKGPPGSSKVMAYEMWNKRKVT